MANMLNAAIEDFVTARYLFYQAQNNKNALKAWNQRTFYGDPEETAEFGLVAGLYKASFRIAIDIFDKIGSFLVLYLGIGRPDEGYYFTNFRFEGKSYKKGFHPKIITLLRDNYFLMGLYDLRGDFFRQEYPGPLKDTRNAAVHRALTLYLLGKSNDEGASASWHLGEFVNLTFLALRQSKAAILSLVGAVNLEEQRRRTEREDMVSITSPLNLREPLSSRASGKHKVDDVVK